MYRLLLNGRILPTVTCSALLVGAATAQTTLRTYNGDAQDDRLGASVSCAGDVNNDGFPDVIVGAPEDGFVFNLREGYARVYSGLNGSTLFTLNGSALAQGQGVAVDGAGNVNGDANDDVVVGAPTAGASLNGIVRVYSGANQAVLHTFTGAANDELGRAVASAGDVNNDGRDDIIVGAPNADGGGTNAGFARVYSGLTGGTLYTVSGSSVGQRVGISVDGVGDLNNDGFDDFIVGSVGSVRVYSGQTGLSLLGPFTGGVDDAYGVSVAGVGDVNNDNVPDFAIGATQDSNVFNQLPGYVQIRSGTDGSVIRTLNGAANAERFGASVSGAGDVNGDGFDEVIVGADQSALNLPGYAKVYSGLNGATLHTFNGTANGDRFGSTVAGCGDLDGNGKWEFLIGAPFASPVTGIKAGTARHIESNLLGGGGPTCTTTNFCVLSPNSAGPGAAISNTGSTSLAANDLTLVTTGLPPAPIGIYFYGAQEVQMPFGNGQQCAGGPQVFRIGVAVGSMGTSMLTLNNNAPVLSQITSGSTWKFQYWFRDVNGGGAQFNLSNGLSATFCD